MLPCYDFLHTTPDPPPPTHTHTATPPPTHPPTHPHTSKYCTCICVCSAGNRKPHLLDGVIHGRLLGVRAAESLGDCGQVGLIATRTPAAARVQEARNAHTQQRQTCEAEGRWERGRGGGLAISKPK